MSPIPPEDALTNTRGMKVNSDYKEIHAAGKNLERGYFFLI
jgi:hypothetical protein